MLWFLGAIMQATLELTFALCSYAAAQALQHCLGADDYIGLWEQDYSFDIFK